MKSAVAAAAAPRQVVLDLLALAKPRITGLVLFTALVGYWLAPGAPSDGTLAATLVGLTLAVAGANALNQLLERDSDARMTRTADRPLPSGRMAPEVVLVIGGAAGLAGVALLALRVGALAATLTGFALASYVWVYTPLKRVTPMALPIGAIPGALPPLCGAVAAAGQVEPRGLALFAILFVWQLPHFLALTLLCREDYQRAGLRVWSVARGVPDTHRWIALSTAALVGVTLLPAALGIAGWAYALAAAGLGGEFLHRALRPARPGGERAWARSLFVYSLVHLPLVLAAFVADVVL